MRTSIQARIHAVGRLSKKEETFQSPSDPDGRRRVALVDPAKLQARRRTQVRVDDAGGNAGLEVYMRLPVEQYNLVDPERICRSGPEDFELRVGAVEFLGVRLDPVVQARVSVVDGIEPHVEIGSTSCVLNAGGILERLDLDERFRMQMSTKLHWDTGEDGRGSIMGDCSVEVWCEVIPPFDRLPRSFLEKSCSSVMEGIIRVLLPAFLKYLRNDYLEWASNAGRHPSRQTNHGLQPVNATIE